MDAYTTPRLLTRTPAQTSFSEAVTKIGTNVADTSAADLAAVIGGVVSAVLLLFICGTAVMLWCLSRQKGSYVTNETDDDDNIDEDESVGSDTALQAKEPLKAKEDE